jgi:hypothetical protein
MKQLAIKSVATVAGEGQLLSAMISVPAERPRGGIAVSYAEGLASCA